MALEEIIKAYRELGQQISELEAQRKALSAQILEQMPKNTKTFRLEEYLVRRYSKLSIRTPLETAKSLGAVKLEEVVDKERIKQLYEEGLSIPKVSEIQWVQVTLTPTKVS